MNSSLDLYVLRPDLRERLLRELWFIKWLITLGDHYMCAPVATGPEMLEDLWAFGRLPAFNHICSIPALKNHD